MTKREELKTKLKEYMDNIEATTYMFNFLDPSLASWNGKLITKRLIDRLRLTISGDFNLYIRKGWNGLELTMAKGNKTLTLRLSDGQKRQTLNMDYVRKQNERYYTQLDTYVKYRNAVEHTDEWFDEYMKIRQDVVALKNKMKEFECEYLIDWSDLRYTI